MPPGFDTGFVPKVIESEGETYRYAVWVPSDYRPDRRWPVILFLHGMGECGDDGVFHTTVGLGRAIRSADRQRRQCAERLLRRGHRPHQQA